MLRSNLKLALRNLVRNRLQSVIQILSLSVGLTVFSMVALYLYDEQTVDRSNPMYDQVYRIQKKIKVSNIDVVNFPMGPVILDKVPVIRDMTRIYHLSNMSVSKDEESSVKKKVNKVKSSYVDTGFFKIFPQEFLYGDPGSVFEEPHSIIICESVAEKLFGHVNPLGQFLHFFRQEVKITGVVKDPVNSHLKFDILVPTDLHWIVRNSNGKRNDSKELRSLASATYISLQNNISPSEVEKKISDVWHDFSNQAYGPQDRFDELELIPLKEVISTDIVPWHNYMRSSDRKIRRNFFVLGLVLLLLGIINYINLTTARATQRNKEIAVKKILGSSRSRLIIYFLTESVITTIFSFLIAVTCLQLLYTAFNNLLQADINLYFLLNPLAWMIILTSILLVGILSGIYPAIRLSTGMPVIALAGDQEGSGKGMITRRFLMLLQFTTAVVLLITIMVMSLQIRFMKNQDLGFPEEQIVWRIVGGIKPEDIVRLIPRLEQLPGIEKVCMSSKVPGYGFQETNQVWKGENSVWDGMDIEVVWAGPGFFDVYDLDILVGKENIDQFSRRRLTIDTTDRFDLLHVVMNETAAKALNGIDPIGYKEDRRLHHAVVRDFHYQSLEYEVKPLFIAISKPGDGWLMNLRIKSNNIQKTLRAADKEWQRFNQENSGQQLEEVIGNSDRFKFLDDTFNEQYEETQRIQKASGYLSVLAVIIACLGLYGLSTFLVQQRTKEIGIRKSLGASDLQLFMLLSWDLIRWVSLSVLIGCPAGWLITKHWQQQFAYKAEIGIWVYFAAAILAFSVSFFTSAWQAFKTARTNPIDSLRYE